MTFRVLTPREMMRALTGLPDELCGPQFYSAADVASWWWRLLCELERYPLVTFYDGRRIVEQQ